MLAENLFPAWKAVCICVCIKTDSYSSICSLIHIEQESVSDTLKVLNALEASLLMIMCAATPYTCCIGQPKVTFTTPSLLGNRTPMCTAALQILESKLYTPTPSILADDS